MQFLAAGECLAGGHALIGVDAHDDVAVFLGVGKEIGSLLSEGKAVAGLLIAGHTDIKCCSFWHNENTSMRV